MRFEKVNKLITGKELIMWYAKMLLKLNLQNHIHARDFYEYSSPKIYGKMFSKNHVQHDFSFIYGIFNSKSQCAWNSIKRLVNS